MIYPGTDLKFKIAAVSQLINLQEHDFNITVRDPYKRIALQLTKADCFHDEDGNLYFTLEKPLRGTYYAYFTTAIADGDFPDRKRVMKDACELVEVGAHGGGVKFNGCCSHLVGYELVWAADVKETE